MGRKSLLSESCIDKLEQAILIGATYELAAMFAGISERTFERWRAQMVDAKEGTSLADLRERLRQAEGRAAIGWLAKIEKAATEGNWTAAAWKLQKRYPETYDRSFQKVAFTDPSGEQPWEPTVGLSVLLAAARTAQVSTNGHQPPALPMPADEKG